MVGHAPGDRAQPFSDRVGERGAHIEHEAKSAVEPLRELRVALERWRQQREARGDVEVQRGRDVAQRCERATEQRRCRLAVVDVQRAAVEQHEAEVVVGAERVAPWQPVDQHRRLVDEERPDQLEHGLVRAQHPMRVDHALRHTGRPGGEQQLGDCVRPHIWRRRRAGRPHQLVQSQRARALAARDQHRFGRQRVERGPERPGVVGEHEPGTGELGDRLDPRMVRAHQGVGNADRHHGDAGGVRAQADQQVLDRVTRQDHHRTLRAETEVEEGTGQGVFSAEVALERVSRLLRYGELATLAALVEAAKLLETVLGSGPDRR